MISVLPGRHRMKSRLKIGFLILVFALAALPFAATFALYYPDERHYTDGALMMLQHGDWLVPRTDTGKPRFQKPPLAYWSVAVSYETFGIAVFTSRLPFLLASCGTLWLTYRLARRLTNSVETALLAAIVLLSHPQYFLCSVRSMPDALLAFFITLSAYGFLRLVVFGEHTAGPFWMAYGGAAGATMSKGLPGAGIVVFAWAFACWQARDWRAIKKIIHPPSLASIVILVGAWFGYIFWRQGALAIRVFFNDQVTGNFHGHWWFAISRAALFALILILNFMPWSLTAVEWFAREKSSARGSTPPAAQQFILAWTGLLIAAFAFGANISVRYLLPATPLLAVLLADWLQRAEGTRLFFSLGRNLKIVLATLTLAILAEFFVDSQWPSSAILFALICGWFLFGIMMLGLGALWRKSISVAEALGLALLLGWGIFFTAVIPIRMPDSAWQIAVTLRLDQTRPLQPVLLIGDLKLASRVRVLVGKNWTVVQANTLTPAAAVNYTRVLVPEKEAGEFVNLGWTVRTAAVSFGVPPRGELWDALKSRQLPEMLARHTQKICLATRE